MLYDARNSTIVCALSINICPIGIRPIKEAQSIVPNKFPNQISPNFYTVISFVVNKPALPVNNSPLNVTIVINPKEKKKAPSIPPV